MKDDYKKHSRMYKELQRRRFVNYIKGIDYVTYILIAPFVAFCVALAFTLAI